MKICAQRDNKSEPRVERAAKRKQGGLRTAAAHPLKVVDLGVERSLKRSSTVTVTMRFFSLTAATDDDEDVDDLAAGHGATRSRHAAAAGEFFGVLRPPRRVQTARRRQAGERPL